MAKKKKINKDPLISNPLLAIAQGISSSREEQVFEEEPVNLDEFIESKQFLNQKWNGRTGCRPKLKDILMEVVKPEVREAILLLGKGCLGGETTIYTDEGFKLLKDLKDKKFKVLSRTENNDFLFNDAMCLSRGKNKVRKYYFSNGRNIVMTDNHNVEIYGKQIVRADQLKIGDLLKSIKAEIKIEMQWVKLEKVEELVEEQEVFDILCNDPYHNFVANSISVENSGKDFGSAILQLYGIYKCLCMVNPQSYYGLAPSKIYFVNTARNETQAKKVFFTQFTSLLLECPWFQGKYSEPGVGAVSFTKNVEALSANSQAYAWLGFNTIQWVGDELAFFLESDDNEESESRSEECWEAAYGSCQTRFPKDYKMIGITTPRYDDDFVMKKFTELKSRPNGYVVQAATWDINPNITKEDFKYAFVRDYRRTMRDFGAAPMGVIESFWPEPDMVENFVCETCRDCPIYKDRKMNGNMFSCWDYDDCKANGYKGNGEYREWFKPSIENNEYYMHFDLAKNKDRIGFCLGNVYGSTKIEMDSFKLKQKFGDEFEKADVSEEELFEIKPLIHVSAMGFISTDRTRDGKLLKNGEFYYSAIRDNIIFRLREKGFKILKITFDQFQSHDMQQILEDNGIQTDLISLDRTDEIPIAAKYSITEGRVKYSYSQLLCEEARYLKVINGKKIDHAKFSSKDAWDSFAGTIYNCEKAEVNSGSFGFLTEETDED